MARVNPWRLHISGRERVQPGQVYVIVSNHQSFADIPVVSHVNIDAKWLGKAEMFRVPLIGWMLRMAGDIPVARGDRRKSAQALLQCARYLRHGCSIVFFPEGTRSRDGQVLPFNEGPFQLAIRERVPVLPLVVEGTGDALPRNSWLFGGARDIHLRILEPVSVEGWTVKQSGELRDAVRREDRRRTEFAADRIGGRGASATIGLEASLGRCWARASNPLCGTLCRGWVRLPLASANNLAYC